MAMETSEFDATLGGAEHLPFSANSFKFATSRSVEIAAMTESILRPSKTNLIFQTLPVHMRRRVMSHNSKRLPRKLREGHLEQLRKSGVPPKQKRPSRKYRRRPANLLEEYNRRQKLNVWLETHIWHAKRFHMIQRWKHRLPYAPCDKAFRACYRATSAHCLLQDISYFTPIHINGTIEDIKNLFSNLTNGSCGLGITAKAFTSGNREGAVHLYNINSFPYGYIGKVNFLWPSSNGPNTNLWLFAHPSQANYIEKAFNDLLHSNSNNDIENPVKKRKLSNHYSENIQIKLLPGIFNRFRLTGPNSHAVLARSLKCVDNEEKVKHNDWISLLNKNECKLHLKEKHEYWQSLSLASSPSQLPSSVIVGLVVRDPRLSRPLHRTKVFPQSEKQIPLEALISIPQLASTSPLWDTSLHESIKKKRMSNTQFIEHVTKTQLVPGEVNVEDPALQSIPIVLIQRPGSQNSNIKKIGYGSGWDIIIPSGYGLPFWQTFIMFGARSGGLRETESLSFEMGECYVHPDSEAGKQEEIRIESELKEKYFKRPPSKRVNYIKLAVNSPFRIPWKMLLQDWSDNSLYDFYVLRDKKLLENLQGSLYRRNDMPTVQNGDSCLVPVYIHILGKGTLSRHAHICLPVPGDSTAIKALFEPHHDDHNEKLRKEKRKQHIKNIKCWRRKLIKLKKGGMINTKLRTQNKHEPSEYVKMIRDLWLPSNIKNVRFSASRQIMGYLSQGAFSFSEAKSCGVGYVAYNALRALVTSGQNKVLVRNTSARKYRLANLHIIT